MFEKLGAIAYNWSQNNDPWTNVYGMARTLIALSTALTLALNPTEFFFRPGAVVQPNGMPNVTRDYEDKLQLQLRPIVAEAICRGMSEEQFAVMQKDMFRQLMEHHKEAEDN